MDEGVGWSPAAVMWSIGEIAERDGVSKQAVSKKVKDLVELGLAVERDGQGRVLKVNVAQYDMLRGRTDDPSKAQAPGRMENPQSADPRETYDEALRQKTWHEAERKRLELDELKGVLVRADKIRDAARCAGEEIAAVIDRLPNSADDLAAAMNREGIHGVRVALKQLAGRLRSEISATLSTAADVSPQATAFGHESTVVDFPQGGGRPEG